MHNHLKEFYNAKIDSSSPRLQNKISEILFAMNIKAENYLDIGCNDGTFTIKIAEAIQAKNMYGVDIAETILKMAEEKKIKTFKVDVNCEKLPFPNEYFDFISAVDVIEHLVNSDNFLSEVQRTLKNNRFFLISTPNLGSWLSIISLILGYVPPSYDISLMYRVGKPFGVYKYKFTTSGHIKLYTTRALLDHLSVYGFKALKVVGVPTINCKHSSKIVKLLSILDTFFSVNSRISSGVILIAKKVA
ncbi:MAG: class I SAM-dependent methyltransferase [Candidatus Baldrarchaeia archaeon]